MEQYLECGEIVNTHGLNGELKVVPWCDSPEFLAELKRIFILGSEYKIERAAVSGHNVLLKLAGVSGVQQAMALKGKILLLDRADVTLGDGEYFFRDAIGLAVFDESGAKLGTLTDILERPANEVFVISGEREILVPNVEEFVKIVDIEAKRIVVKLIEGM
ncbi:MAG: ribosome maturation factor RimM [Oscillospiraceae bacterium]|jgi:16S rRNA processing protein RimM|nr:ribosome maturation factor RimM [Oscillospiraceae bacterium]